MKGNRKVLIIGGTILLTAVLAVFKRLDGNVVSIYVAAIAAFAGGNAWEHFTKRSDP